MTSVKTRKMLRGTFSARYKDCPDAFRIGEDEILDQPLADESAQEMQDALEQPLEMAAAQGHYQC